MKPTIKVSIGGYAFNLEDDAFQLVDEYLKKLKIHFSGKSEGQEIISDVEARMAELLQMKMLANTEVVTAENASEVIKIMGNPKDFDDEPSEPSSPPQEEKPLFPHKKLYRDMDNRVIGGVCSGLGYYFRIDPVIFRLIFVGLALMPSMFNWIWFSKHTFHNSPSIGFLTILLYIILWIVVPKAQTLKQKIVMTGKDPSISNMESGNVQLRRSQPSVLLKILKVFFGIIIGIICVSLLISIIAILGAFFGFYAGKEYGNISEILDIVGINSFDLKLSLLLMLILPIIGMLYLSIKLLFQMRFRKADLAVSLFAFLLWIGSSFYFVGIAAHLTNKHQRIGKSSDIFMIQTQSNTLHVKLPEQYANATVISKDEHEIYKIEEDGKLSFYFFPTVKIKEDTTLTEFKIEFIKKAYESNRRKAKEKAMKYTPAYEVTDSLLLLYPKIYNKENIWDGEYYDLEITTPPNKTVRFENQLPQKRLKISFTKENNPAK